MNLVRFCIREMQQPYTDWLLVYSQLSELVRETIPSLWEKKDHPWNDKSEYVIFDGAKDDQLPLFQQIADTLHCSFQYPCHRDISAFGDGGKWYYAQ